MTGLLASVRSVEEANIALQTPIDILDMKEPSAGALGALDADVIRAIVKVAGGRCTTSATAGDLPPQGDVMARRVREVAALGVDYVKVGLFGPRYLEKCLPVLRDAAREMQLVGVLFADRLADFEGPCRLLKAAGFAGVMVDTADKANGSVRRCADDDALQRFVNAARECGLLCGIAGSLGVDDIEPLREMGPDYLGFRTALCEGGKRAGKVSAAAIGRALEKTKAGNTPENRGGLA